MRRKGFTLIELLVVVAILVILVMLLLPGLDNARQKSLAVLCANNMRNLTQAWLLYAGDHKGQLVNGGTNGGTPSILGCSGNANCYPSCASPWMSTGNTMHSITNYALWPYVRSLETYKCPASLNPIYWSNYAIWTYLNSCPDQCYWSCSYCGDVPPNVNGPAYVVNLSQITRPGRTFCFIEEDDYRGSNLGSWVLCRRPDFPHWVDYVPATHQMGDNISFCDGHVEYMKWKDPDVLKLTNFYQPWAVSTEMRRLQAIVNY